MSPKIPFLKNNRWSIADSYYLEKVLGEIKYTDLISICDHKVIGYDMPCGKNCIGPYSKCYSSLYVGVDKIIGPHVCPDCGQVFVVLRGNGDEF